MGNVKKDLYYSVKEATKCFSKKKGWVSRTVTSIRAEIDAFKSRQSAAGAQRLEDWIITLTTRCTNYEECANWLDGKDDPKECTWAVQWFGYK